MDLTLTDDQELIATTAADFLEARCPPAHVRDMDDDPTGYSPSLWKEMADLGWTGMAIPTDFDGAGAGFLELCLVIEQMGRVLLPSPFTPTVAVCAPVISRHGDDDQKAEVLTRVASGETILTYARASPGAGWENEGSAVVTRAVDDGFVLDGVAMFVPDAHIADQLVVITHHDGGGTDELTAFLVPGDADGLSTDALETTGLGHEHRVTFDGVTVPVTGVLGTVGGGIDVVDTASAYGAAATCAEMIGGAQRVLDMTVGYATDRQQFDTPIGSFQAVQHHCADMAVDVLTSRLIAYEAIWSLSEGVDAGEEVSMAKAWVSEAYRRVCALGHQVHGAIGFTREHDLHLYLRHAVGTELSFGDADHHWEQLARLLRLPARSV